MRRSDRAATALVIAGAILVALAAIVQVLAARATDRDRFADGAVATIVQFNVLNSMNGPWESLVRDAFVREVRARPDDSYVRTRRALDASGRDPAVVDDVRASAAELHERLLAGDPPDALALDSSRRRAPFIAAWATEDEFRALLGEHLQLPPELVFGGPHLAAGSSSALRAADALAPLVPALWAVGALLLAAAVAIGRRRSQALRRAGVGLVAAGIVLWLAFEATITLALRRSRSVAADVFIRLADALIAGWQGYAAGLAVAGLVAIAASFALRRRERPATRA